MKAWKSLCSVFWEGERHTVSWMFSTESPEYPRIKERTQGFNPCELGLNTTCDLNNVNKPLKISELQFAYIKNGNNTPCLTGLSQGLSGITWKGSGTK